MNGFLEPRNWCFVRKMCFLFQGGIFRFHVNLRVSMDPNKNGGIFQPATYVRFLPQKPYIRPPKKALLAFLLGFVFQNGTWIGLFRVNQPFHKGVLQWVVWALITLYLCAESNWHLLQLLKGITQLQQLAIALQTLLATTAPDTFTGHVYRWIQRIHPRESITQKDAHILKGLYYILYLISYILYIIYYILYIIYYIYFIYIYIGSTFPPPRIPVANEGLGWDSLKMFHNPGGDWNPGWGVDLRYIFQRHIHHF